MTNPVMSTLRLKSTILLSFLAAQALSLPCLDPRYHPGHDIRAPAAQSATFTTTTILAQLITLRTSASEGDRFAKQLDDENPTIGMPSPDLEGFDRKSKARRGEDNDSHHTLALNEGGGTANQSLESDSGQNTDPNAASLSGSTRSPISTSSSPVSTNTNENQKEARTITKRKDTSNCAPQDYECKGMPQGAVTANGCVQVVDEINTHLVCGSHDKSDKGPSD